MKHAISTTSLDERDRALLGAMADVLIPSGDGMPSASQAGASGRWLDEVLRVRPDFGPPLAAVIERARATDAAEAVADLRSKDPAGFGIFAEVVAGAYFLNPEVRKAIGYAGQQKVPIAAEDPPDYEQEGLIASVKSRGPIYRPTPHR